MSSQCPRALVNLVSRLAEMTKPFNAQDAILIIRSLNTLRVPSGQTRRICEKAAIALASAPRGSVPTEVIVDSVNSLVSLHSASLPVVHGVLTKRFLSLDTTTSDVKANANASSTEAAPSSLPRPQTLQKAALCLLKMGKRYAPPKICDSVLHQLHVAIQGHPGDEPLQFAYIGLYPYTSFLSQRNLVTNGSGNVRGSLKTLLVCAQSAEKSVFSSSASQRGSAAWQAMHLLVTLAHVESVAANPANTSSTHANSFVAECRALGDSVLRSRLSLTFSFARYADFLSDFSTELGRYLPLALHPLQSPGVLSRGSKYDIAKVCSALGAAISVAPRQWSQAEKVEALRLYPPILAGVIGFVTAKSCDITTLASVWRLAASLSAVCPLAESVMGDLCVVTESALTSQSFDPAFGSQCAWLAVSMTRVLGVSQSEKIQQCFGCLQGVLLGLTLDSMPLRSLAQLWYAISSVQGTASAFPAAFHTTVAAAIEVASLDASAPAAIGMLLSACERLATCCNTAEDEIIKSTAVKVTERILCDDGVPMEIFQRHQQALQCCLRLLVSSGVPVERLGEGARTVVQKAAPEDGPSAMLTPAESLQVLISSGEARSRPSASAAAAACEQSWLWASSAASPPSPYGFVLKCAEICQQGGKAIVFTAAAEDGDEGQQHRGKHQRNTFVIPVKQLLSTGAGFSLTATDAAHVVRLMSDALGRTGAVRGASLDLVHELVQVALAGVPRDATVPGTLFLLHANKELSVSNKLFTKADLVCLLHRTEAVVARFSAVADTESSNDSIASERIMKSSAFQLVRLARAFMNSQLLFRVGPQTFQNLPEFRKSLRLVKAYVESQLPVDTDLLVKLHFLLGE